MIEALIILFILSAGAWMKGDDSMAWFVILGVVLMVLGFIMSSCSS